jgi:RND family efflux transporter MFP subunit
MRRTLITGAIVLAAIAVFAVKYWQYVTNPWTRDGQVRAQVIQITSRVTAPIVNLPIVDNQLVKTGDLLFEIDSRTFKAALDEAQATLEVKKVTASNQQANANRYRNANKRAPGSVSKEDLDSAIDSERAALAEVEQQAAVVENKRLDLEFTEVRAPVDGYVTNLNLRLGSQAVANQPALALVDVNSFWVHGFFRETVIGDMQPGDRAIVTLMSYPDRPLEGRVDSLGWGIAQNDGAAGANLLPEISPTFEWIRLAQRVPVRVHLSDVPDDVELRVGTTASVLVMTGSQEATGAPVPPVPRPLQ